MNETGYGETELYDNKAIDRNRKTYPKMNETGYRKTDFAQKGEINTTIIQK